MLLRRVLTAVVLLQLCPAYHAHYLHGYSGPLRGENGQNEGARLRAFRENGHSWPPKAWKGWPPTEHQLSEKFKQRLVAKENHARNTGWNYWTQLVQSCVMPQFTDVGFKVAEGPPELVRLLKKSYADNLPNAVLEHGMRPKKWGTRSDGDEDLHVPKWISQNALNNRVHREMKPHLEKWSGVELDMGQIYGLRVYTNGSYLINHLDRVETHVISFIFHVGHDTDEPWPLEIEDHDGTIHAVTLNPGQVVYYESAKQYHARLTPLRGRHYASVFGHYMPKHHWNWTKFDVTTAVPKGFSDKWPKSQWTNGEVPKRPIDVYVEDYWKSRGMGVPNYPAPDDRPVHVFPDSHGGVDPIDDDL